MGDNAKKSEQLGISFSTAQNQLRKLIMFDLVKKCGLDICYQCGEKIESVSNLSIEHMTPWLDSENPKELFFDLKNIAFSHTSCNYKTARKTNVRRGNTHPCAKLTEKDVYEIKHLLKARVYTQIEIAEMYGISRRSLGDIASGKNWPQVTIR